MAILSALCFGGVSSAQAQICDLPSPERPADYPAQPINIFIPRSSASGSFGLSDEIARAIRELTDENGNPLNIEVNTLFKFGGDQAAALSYFLGQPPNGYNVIQLTDTYASQLARAPQDEGKLVPISMAQITPSQLYIRRNDPNYSDLPSFIAYASGKEGSNTPQVSIALFGTSDEQFGLEDILLRKFTDLYAMDELQAQALPALETEPATAPTEAAKPKLAIGSVGFESGSERYFSLFEAPAEMDHRVDALIEQPGDVARLIGGGLLKPIFTFLPEQDLDAGVGAALRDRLGATASFPQEGSQSCAVYYRYRGFFIPAGVPPERRRFLEWVFRKAFDSESFRAFNQREYMDVLYSDSAISGSYCSTDQLNAFFQNSVHEYRECLNDLGPRPKSQ